MFRTDDSDMAGVPGMFGQGLAHWHVVSRVLHTHWYHVTGQISLDGRTSECSLMINDVHRLQQVLQAEVSDARITSVQVVTPPRMNNTSHWRMERVVRVTLGQDQSDCNVCVLEVEGGAIYHDSFIDNFEPLSLKKELTIYQSDCIG